MYRSRALELKTAVSRAAVGLALLGSACLTVNGCGKNGDATVASQAGTQSSAQGGGGRVASAPDLATPKATLETFAKALETGDLAAAKAATLGNEQENRFLSAMVQVVSSFKKLQDAATAKFGAEGQAVVGSKGPTNDLSKQLADADIKENGDTATVVSKNQKPGSKPLLMKRVNGQWKVDLASMMAEESGHVEAALPMLEATGKAANQAAADINAGKYKTAAEAKTGIANTMMQAMFGSIPQHQGVPMGGAPGAMPGAPGGPGAPGMGGSLGGAPGGPPTGTPGQ